VVVDVAVGAHASTTVNVVFGIGAALVAALVAVITFRAATRATRLTEELRGPAAHQETLEQRLDQLSVSMQQSARLVEQVSAELDARAVTARRLREEVESAEALAALHKDQAEAVRRLVRSEMTEELATARRRIRRDSLTIGIGAFVAGALVSSVVTLLVYPLG